MSMIYTRSHLDGSLLFPDHQLINFANLLCEIVSLKVKIGYGLF